MAESTRRYHEYLDTTVRNAWASRHRRPVG